MSAKKSRLTVFLPSQPTQVCINQATTYQVDRHPHPDEQRDPGLRDHGTTYTRALPFYISLLSEIFHHAWQEGAAQANAILLCYLGV